MNRPDADTRIDQWLHDELDAVLEPTRALTEALDAVSSTAQRHGRLFWLRQLFGLEQSTVQRGSFQRPEVVLTPAGGDAGGVGMLGRQGAISMPIVLAVLAVALAVQGAMAWITVGPGSSLIGGSDTEKPIRPIEQTGPQRVILVGGNDANFTTLAAAVAEAESGDRIELYPGTYPAEVVISEDIEIVGVGERESIIVEPLPLADGEARSDRHRVLITLEGNDSIIRGFTLRGSDHGTAIVVDGGAPLLEDLVIDPAGEMVTSSPTDPREALEMRAGSRATVKDSLMTSLALAFGGAKATLENVSFEGGCLMIEDAGTALTIRDVSFDQSGCPGFSISVAGGAHADIAASPIVSVPGSTGIRVANSGSSVDITGTSITGGAAGLTVGPGAAAIFQRSYVQGSDVGISVNDAELALVSGAIIGNSVGVQVAGESFLEASDIDICENGTNLDLNDEATIPLDAVTRNRVCIDGSTELATETAP